MIALWNQKSRNVGTSCSTFWIFVNWNVIRHKQNWRNKTLNVSYNLAFVLSTIIMASEWSQHQFSINCMMIHLRGAIITMDLPFSPFNINRQDTNKYRYILCLKTDSIKKDNLPNWTLCLKTDLIKKRQFTKLT